MQQKNNDTPVIVALGAIAVLLFLIFLALLVPHQPSGGQIASQASAQQPQNGDLWDWIAKDSISFFTVVLAFLTGGLVYTGIQQVRIMRDAHEASGRLEAISEQQMLISGQQTNILLKQKEIQRQEFLISHRPKIRIRSVAGPLNCSGFSKPQFVVNYVNVGDTEANIINTRIAVSGWIEGNLTPLIPTEDADVNQPLQSGYAAMAYLAVPDNIKIHQAGAQPIVVTGAVFYKDSTGHVRSTAFGKRNEPPSIFLTSIKDFEDINYED